MATSPTRPAWFRPVLYALALGSLVAAILLAPAAFRLVRAAYPPASLSASAEAMVMGQGPYETNVHFVDTQGRRQVARVAAAEGLQEARGDTFTIAYDPNEPSRAMRKWFWLDPLLAALIRIGGLLIVPGILLVRPLSRLSSPTGATRASGRRSRSKRRARRKCS